MSSKGYDPDLDKVVMDPEDVEIDGRVFRIEGRQYAKSTPKLVISSVWYSKYGKEQSRRLNGVPLEVATYIAENNILEKFVERMSSNGE